MIVGAVGVPAGTSFDDDRIDVSVGGNIGDVIQVDLMDLVARQILGLPTKDNAAWKNMDARELVAATARINEQEKKLQNFYLSAATDWVAYTDPKELRQNPNGMQLVTDGFDPASGAAGRPKLVTLNNQSRPSSDSYWTRGLFFLAPNITDADLKQLRSGQKIELANQAIFIFTYQEKDANGNWLTKRGSVDISAQDYPATGKEQFFGDRALNNPGYSAFTMFGELSVGGKYEKLDAFRVEQRLAYLGFPSMRSSGDNTPKAFVVDGKWGENEARAALMFSRVVNYNGKTASQYVVSPHSSKFEAAAFDAAVSKAAKELVIKDETARQDDLADWLNAFNAPHWMRLFPVNSVGEGISSSALLPSWSNTQAKGPSTAQSEMYASSWVRDLMRAYEYANADLRSNVARGLIFNGSTDGNLLKTPATHASHDLGMAMDLGFTDTYIASAFQTVHDERTIAINGAQLPEATRLNSWSALNAIDLVSKLTTDKPTDQTVNSKSGRYEQSAALSQFLALYSLTQKTSGDWSNIVLVHRDSEDKVRSALFGSGDKAGGLIASVLIGRDDVTTTKEVKDKVTGKVMKVTKVQPYNGYDAMRQVLDAVGVTNSKADPHQNHFHISFRPPKMQEIAQPRMGLVASSAKSQVSAPAPTVSALMGDIRIAERRAQKPRDAALGICQMMDVTPPDPVHRQISLANIDQLILPASKALSSEQWAAAKIVVIQQPAYGTIIVEGGARPGGALRAEVGLGQPSR